MGNQIGRKAAIEDPWASFEHARSDWEWRILKAYKQGDTSRKDQAARFHCAVMSPHTMGNWELGDVYVTDLIFGQGVQLMTHKKEFDEWLEDWGLAE
jgi:hypothetical protein